MNGRAPCWVCFGTFTRGDSNGHTRTGHGCEQGKEILGGAELWSSKMKCGSLAN